MPEGSLGCRVCARACQQEPSDKLMQGADRRTWWARLGRAGAVGGHWPARVTPVPQ
jgi:hypothetical protein